VLELQLNGAPLPPTLLVGLNYTLVAITNSLPVTPLSWSVTTGGLTVASGQNSEVRFTPLTTASHLISVQLVGEFGLITDLAASVNIISQQGTAMAGVVWSQPVFAVGAPIEATIVAQDTRALPPLLVSWILYRNSQQLLVGTGTVVSYGAALAGLYRLKGTATTNDGLLAFDSTVYVGTPVAGRPNLPIPDEGGTMVYIGAVFTQNLTGGAGTVSATPYQLGSATELIHLLPGSTHWSFDLDPDAGMVDDELVVRTKKGNWCLNGLAGGLSGEDVGYDYGYSPAMIPAPADKTIRFTVDLFKVHGTQFNAFNCRVRIKCYRRLPQNVYGYSRCSSTPTQPGGLGRRARRWAALFTNLDMQADALSGLNRLGVPAPVISYTTPATTSVPLMALSSSGQPDPVPGFSGLYHTDSNLYAYYEADGQADIEAYALSAIETVRPCCISLQMFVASKPTVVNVPKRAYGQLAVYLTDGAVIQGSVLTITVWRTDGLFAQTFQLPVTSTTYVNANDTLQQVGVVSVDISDFQFDGTGIVVDFAVDESHALQSAVPVPAATPSAAPDVVYSSVYGATVLFDGACYTNPVYVPVFDGDAVVVTPVSGCQDTACGPTGVYCYTSIAAPSELVNVPQPFGLPANYIAFGDNPARCYGNPAAQVTVAGSLISTTLYNGTTNTDLRGYSGSSLCGYSYLYTDCQAAYAPCAGYACSIIVVYPVSSTPHGTVQYGGSCYTFAGSTQTYGTNAVVPAASTSPVSGCLDPACSLFDANGSVVAYFDQQTKLTVPVTFAHLDYGVGNYGVAPAMIDAWTGGLVPGSTTVAFAIEPQVTFYTSPGTGVMEFNFGAPGVPKCLVLTRNGVDTVYPAQSSYRVVSLLPGDVVSVRVANTYGRLPLQLRFLRFAVSWLPVNNLPRLYDTVEVAYSGSTAIQAVGFCAYTTQGVYSFYGTLPFSGSMTGPVNPDNLVTVTAQDGTERRLLSNSAQGDINLYELTHLPWYAGEVLTGPFTFNFYAGRSALGAHGEMDVWFDTSGTFPAYLAAGNYSVLAFTGSSYRRDASPLDTHRNAYAVTDANTAVTLCWPAVYVSTTGGVISAAVVANGIVFNGTEYVAPYWPLIVYDPGLSDVIVSAAGAVADAGSWTMDTGEPWTSDTGDPWQISTVVVNAGSWTMDTGEPWTSDSTDPWQT